MVSGLSRRQWLAIGGFVVLAALLIASTADRLRQPAADAIASAPSIPASAPTPDAATVGPTGAPTGAPTALASSSPAATSSVASTRTPEPTAQPTPTDPPAAEGDPRLLFAEFLRRVNDDRATVERLNETLAAATQAQDTAAVRAASVEILDFVDSERDWLRDHPPAACYATAHRAARAMVTAYGDAAERFFDWSGTGGGLAGLDALRKAVDAAGVANDKLIAFGDALEATACPG